MTLPGESSDTTRLAKRAPAAEDPSEVSPKAQKRLPAKKAKHTRLKPGLY
jgi:hypothetical protein